MWAVKYDRSMINSRVVAGKPRLYAAGIYCKSLRFRQATYVIETVTVFSSV